MIWPTEIGTFLIRRGDAQRTPAAGQVPEEALDPMMARSVPVVSGYLADGPGRPLRWVSPVESATSTVVLRFERSDRSRTAGGNLTAAESAARSLEANVDPGGELVAQEQATHVLRSERPPPVEVAVEEPEPETPPTTRRSVLDEKFVNWVTRRMDDTKVEIPFQLPTEGSDGEPVAPTERVRVRYRTEP